MFHSLTPIYFKRYNIVINRFSYASEHLFNNNDSSTHDRVMALSPYNFQHFKLLGLINQLEILTSYLFV